MGRHYTQHDDIQHIDFQNSNEINCDTQHNVVVLSVANKVFMLSVILLSVVMLNVVALYKGWG